MCCHSITSPQTCEVQIAIIAIIFIYLPHNPNLQCWACKVQMATFTTIKGVVAPIEPPPSAIIQ